MTTLDQSKHEPLARRCAELVGDHIIEGPDPLVSVRVVPFNSLGVLSYISCKNLAGRVLGVIESKKVGDFPDTWHLIGEACTHFREDVHDDTPQALWNIMKAAGMVGADG